jgi:uncharacterized membrane protein YhfC
MLYASIVAQILFMVLAPIVLGRVLVRRGFGGWKLFFIGAAAFVASQIVHIPVLVGLTLMAKQPWFPHAPEAWKLPVNAVVLGLSAGLCEEPARWIALRRFARNARGWKAAILFGAGHGGVEAFLLGVLAAINASAMLVLRALGPERLGVSGDKLSVANEAIAKYWSMSPWMPLVGAGERVMAVTIHLAASVLVMRGVVSGRTRWLWLAVLFHTAVDAVAVYGMKRWGTLPVEALMLPFVALAVGIVALERRRERSVSS